MQFIEKVDNKQSNKKQNSEKKNNQIVKPAVRCTYSDRGPWQIFYCFPHCSYVYARDIQRNHSSGIASQAKWKTTRNNELLRIHWNIRWQLNNRKACRIVPAIFYGLARTQSNVISHTHHNVFWSVPMSRIFRQTNGREDKSRESE